ncbi:hypothetical protein V6N13_116287 [Hibiscus sabdariffa]
MVLVVEINSCNVASIELLLMLRCFDVLTKQDDKGDVSHRDNGSCPGRYLDGNSDLGRASCCVIGLSLSPND